MNDDEKKELEWLIGVYGHESGTTTDPTKQKDLIANYENVGPAEIGFGETGS